jgi:hypothetical protein
MMTPETAARVHAFRPGIYRHYKGGFYRAIGLVAHHDTREPWVLYVSLKQGSMNIRPLVGADGWTDVIAPARVPRFVLVNETLDGITKEPPAGFSLDTLFLPEPEKKETSR